MTINRAFTRIKEGEIHYRYAGADTDEILYMIHSSLSFFGHTSAFDFADVFIIQGDCT